MAIKNKMCIGDCPVCGAKDDKVDWGQFTIGTEPIQEGTCTVCGCKFKEIYHYICTEHEEKENGK